MLDSEQTWAVGISQVGFIERITVKAIEEIQVRLKIWFLEFQGFLNTKSLKMTKSVHELDIF